MSKIITVINGPNLNLLGQREPDKYGAVTLADVEAQVTELAGEFGLRTTCLQSNSEGAIVGMIHAARDTSAGIIINPGAYSHTSIAILDALNAFDGIVVEVHITNIHKRESFRHHSHISGRADGIIVGCGTHGYLLAMRQIATLV